MAVDTIETIPIPRPPVELRVGSIEEVGTALNNIYQYTQEMSRFNGELYNILHSGYLVRSFQVESLTAETIVSGTIATDEIYLFDDRFELNGALGQIIIQDENNTDRVIIGKFGSGTDYGIKVWDSSGAEIINLTGLGSNVVTTDSIATGAVTEDGIATNAVTANKVAANAITAGKINVANLAAISADFGTITAGTINATVSISAAALDTGQLTVNSTGGVSVLVSGGGDFVVDNGGDIILRPNSGADLSLLRFQNAAGNDRLNLGYSPTGFAIGGGEYSGIVASTGSILMSAGTYTVLNGGVAAGVACDFWPDQDNTHTIGNASGPTLRFADVRSVLINGADFCYENGWRDTEPNHVWTWADAKDGTVKMNEKWEPVYWFHADGWIQTENFKKPDIARREPPKKQKRELQ